LERTTPMGDVAVEDEDAVREAVGDEDAGIW
jgi:hypothetical protein